MSRVRKAVILAAGMGTRLLPATKAVPKPMLPIVDKPLLQYAVEEAVASGIEEIIFVIAEGQDSIREHFSANGRIERVLAAKNDTNFLGLVRAPSEMATYHYVFQDQPLGQAHAIWCAREYLADEPFALFFPDDLILGDVPAIGEMIAAYDATGGTVMAVEQVPHEEVFQYGVIAPAGEGDPIPVMAVVEKPPVSEAPSDLAIVGRYVLSETILRHIERTPPGKGGERFIADSIALQIAAGEPTFARRFSGARFDTGRPAGLVIAQVGAAMLRPDVAAQVREPLLKLLGGDR